MQASLKLQFVREKGLAPLLIEWFGRGNFCHVDTVLDDGQLLGARGDLRGGKPRGVQIRPPGYTQFVGRMVITVPVTTEQKAAYLGFLQDQIGKPYDLKALRGFVFGHDWHQPDKWFCSELVAAAAEQANIIPELYCSTAITPGDLALIMSAIGGKVTEGGLPI